MTATPYKFDKYVVVGHWPVSLYSDTCQQLSPIIDREKRIISIDGGCGIKNEGQLNLLIIPHVDCSVNEITNIYYDELPELMALSSQKGSESGTHICWVTREIRLLEKGEEYSIVEHKHSGRRVRIPNAYMRSESESRDYTDRSLDVEAGDVMKLLYKATDGVIVKRNGNIGWYYGSFVMGGEITTKRLTVGKIKLEDKTDVVRILRDDTVKKTYMLPDFEKDEAAEKLFLRLKELSERDDRYVFAVRLDGRVIGFINDVEISDGAVEMGYCFHPQYHGCGYCTEAFGAVIQFLFKKGFREVKCGAFEENLASIRVMQKCGMEKLDHTDEIEYREKTHKCIYYSIKETKE